MQYFLDRWQPFTFAKIVVSTYLTSEAQAPYGFYVALIAFMVIVEDFLVHVVLHLEVAMNFQMTVVKAGAAKVVVGFCA